jgi:uncharacterized protein YndB with AHSA1/START domain
MSEAKQRFSTEIDAPPQRCFETITDFAAYPEWSSVIVSTRVLERGAEGLARRVEFELDMTLRTVRYVLEYRYEPPERLSWTLVEGDLQAVEGSYTFEPLEGGRRTRATCEQAVTLGFWIPGPIRRLAEQKALRDSVLEFKRAVESRRG